MLPAYQSNRFACFYFIIFLLLGLFLFLNLLLAIIYSRFRKHQEDSILDNEKARGEYLLNKFMEISKGKDHLNKPEMYKFFILLHSLVVDDDQDEFDKKEDDLLAKDFKNMSRLSSDATIENADNSDDD